MDIRIFMEYITLALGWIVFYASHTLLASLNIKRKFRLWMGAQYKWYRLIYSLLAAFLFLGLFVYAGSITPNWVFTPSDGSTYFGYMLATVGTIIAVKSMKEISVSRFIGWHPHDDLKEKDELIVNGWYRYVRHPLYLALILIFLGYFLYVPNLASMVHLLALLLYLPPGIYFEEKKLIAIYGQGYIDYQNNVPPILPRFKK
jgi:protein-S-isoprenylcysteine O-methyltransferase Ste14